MRRNIGLIIAILTHAIQSSLIAKVLVSEIYISYNFGYLIDTFIGGSKPTLKVSKYMSTPRVKEKSES